MKSRAASYTICTLQVCESLPSCLILPFPSAVPAPVSTIPRQLVPNVPLSGSPTYSMSIIIFVMAGLAACAFLIVIALMCHRRRKLWKSRKRFPLFLQTFLRMFWNSRIFPPQTALSELCREPLAMGFIEQASKLSHTPLVGGH